MKHKMDITIILACLDCRKVFKKYKYKQDKRGQWEAVKCDYTCPQCSSEMHETGSAFKAPKYSDIKAWQKLEPLFRNGYKFHPDRGNPFTFVPNPPNKNKPSSVPQSEFRKPTRKRNK